MPNELGIWRRRIPSQILEAGLALVLLVTSIECQKLIPYDGVLFLTAGLGYGIGRWFLEAMRDSSSVRIGSLNLQRTISASLAVLSAMGLWMTWLHGH
jgi:prolipoprotein diacylglyceryltransferase